MASPISFDVSWGNDQLFLPDGWSDGTFPGDDNGFTNDFRATAGYGPVRVTALHRMITERQPSWLDEHARVDQMEIAARYTHRFRLRDDLVLSGEASGGVSVLGKLGGVDIQQAWHSGPLVRGRTIGHGLQDRYDGSTSVAPLVGAAGRAEFTPLSWIALTGDVDGQVAFGAMASTGLEAGVQVKAPENPLAVRPFIGAAARGTCQAIFDPRLSMPGGYVPGCYVSPAVTTGVSVGPVSASFALRWNVGGAGHGMGETKLAFDF